MYVNPYESLHICIVIGKPFTLEGIAEWSSVCLHRQEGGLEPYHIEWTDNSYEHGHA